MAFETWLSDEDCQRLWAVCHGTLPDVAASTDELVEFERVVTHVAMLKVGGPEYVGAIIQ
jgi:hypothetical protein